jgi:hypothetical protein
VPLADKMAISENSEVNSDHLSDNEYSEEGQEHEDQDSESDNSEEEEDNKMLKFYKSITDGAKKDKKAISEGKWSDMDTENQRLENCDSCVAIYSQSSKYACISLVELVHRKRNMNST